jgi:Fe-S oxidoreductase
MGPLAISLLLLFAGAFFLFTVWQRFGLLFRLRADDRFDQPAKRIGALLRFGLGQRRMVDDPLPGIMHIFIFAAFMVLALRTITMFGIGFSDTFHLPLLGPSDALFGPYYLARDVVAVLCLIGVGYFFVNRLFVKPDRVTRSGEAYFILAMIAGLMITDLFFEGAALQSAGVRDPWRPAASVAADLLGAFGFTGATLGVLGAACYWAHVTQVLVFGNFLPYGKHFHVITGLPNVYFKRLTPSGRLPKLDLEAEKFGAGTSKDLTWKNLFDVYSCTECGRCETNCPTYVTGKPLTHKQLNQTLKHHLLDEAPLLFGRTKGEPSALVSNAPGDGGAIAAETIWACTTCGWCETACPVLIENVPRIVEMRRYQVLVESQFPPEATRVFKGMETQGNPWGLGQSSRADWAQGLDVPLASSSASGGGDFEYLFWVGCAGSYDDRQKKVSRALVSIFKKAGLSFAILGGEETCTGDPARRLGNEYLFQQLAQQNVETLKKYPRKKIVTQCPHCLNTLRNEYPDFDGHFEVLHHTELLASLLHDARVTPKLSVTEQVTYHDSCYLGRHNGIYEEPRQTLARIPGLNVIEMPRNRREGFCCGAGGGRMWLEEKVGQRINQNRVDEAATTGAKVVVAACPFCTTMLSDGINETGRSEEMRVMDVAEVLSTSLG